jgi:hypothetical protein
VVSIDANVGHCYYSTLALLKAALANCWIFPGRFSNDAGF